MSLSELEASAARRSGSPAVRVEGSLNGSGRRQRRTVSNWRFQRRLFSVCLARIGRANNSCGSWPRCSRRTPDGRSCSVTTRLTGGRREAAQVHSKASRTSSPLPRRQVDARPRPGTCAHGHRVRVQFEDRDQVCTIYEMDLNCAVRRHAHRGDGRRDHSCRRQDRLTAHLLLPADLRARAFGNKRALPDRRKAITVRCVRTRSGSGPATRRRCAPRCGRQGHPSAHPGSTGRCPTPRRSAAAWWSSRPP